MPGGNRLYLASFADSKHTLVDHEMETLYSSGAVFDNYVRIVEASQSEICLRKFRMETDRALAVASTI